MSFDYKSWFEFGAKVSLLWYGIVWVLLVSLAVLFGSALGADMYVQAGLIGGSLVTFAVVVLISGALWVGGGWLYEEFIEGVGFVKKLPIAVQFAALQSITSYIISVVMTGGAITVISLAVLAVTFVIALVFAVITLYIFEYLDWDVPFTSG